MRRIGRGTRFYRNMLEIFSFLSLILSAIHIIQGLLLQQDPISNLGVAAIESFLSAVIFFVLLKTSK